jgi:predicted regulator of Ras-like GTPase activity (Roadblock/LC7/MglB family)
MFQERLKQVVDNVEGSIACVLMGFDGISLDTYLSEGRGELPLDIQGIGLEYSVVLKQIKKTAELLESGDVQEVAIASDKMTTLVRILNDEYFLALALKPGGNYGKGRYLLRVVAPELNREL